MARPSKLPQVFHPLLKLLHEGKSIESAAFAVGISAETLRGWLIKGNANDLGSYGALAEARRAGAGVDGAPEFDPTGGPAFYEDDEEDELEPVPVEGFNPDDYMSDGEPEPAAVPVSKIPLELPASVGPLPTFPEWLASPELRLAIGGAVEHRNAARARLKEIRSRERIANLKLDDAERSRRAFNDREAMRAYATERQAELRARLEAGDLSAAHELSNHAGEGVIGVRIAQLDALVRLRKSEVDKLYEPRLAAERECQAAAADILRTIAERARFLVDAQFKAMVPLFALAYEIQTHEANGLNPILIDPIVFWGGAVSQTRINLARFHGITSGTAVADLFDALDAEAKADLEAAA